MGDHKSKPIEEVPTELKGINREERYTAPPTTTTTTTTAAGAGFFPSPPNGVVLSPTGFGLLRRRRGVLCSVFPSAMRHHNGQRYSDLVGKTANKNMATKRKLGQNDTQINSYYQRKINERNRRINYSPLEIKELADTV